MTRKDFINCADAISNLIFNDTQLNQTIAEFTKIFSAKYDNFDPTTFRKYITDKHDENRRKRMKLPKTSEFQLIE